MANANTSNDKIKYILTEWVAPIVAAIVISLCLNKFVFFIMRIPSESMDPTLKIGDLGIVTRVYNTNNLKRGDVVIFKSVELNETLVKRLIGLPGDKIKITDTGDVYINGLNFEQDFVKHNGGATGDYEVPEGCYFFLGDNRYNSLDSRYWSIKYIEAKYIEGKGQFVIFPFNRISKL